MAIYGALDLGSNSIRLLIARLEEGQIEPLYSGMRTTRLAEGLEKNGSISEAAAARTLKSLQYFLQIMGNYPDIILGAIATSAVREASNGRDLIAGLRQKTGLEIQIVSGEEEARLSYQGASRALKDIVQPVVIDIGGGSTELIFQKESGVRFQSCPIGAVKAAESSASPQEILDMLKPVLDEIIGLKSPLVGVGGTVTSLAAVKMKLKAYDPRLIQGFRLNRDDVAKLLFKLSGMSLAERKNLPGLQPERADIIAAGTMILWVIMSYLDKKLLIVSEADLLHGIIYDISAV